MKLGEEVDQLHTDFAAKVYRLNTYPVIHRGFFHVLVNAVALTPLLERFEVEHGTLTAVALFLGRKSHVPGSRYVWGLKTHH